MSISTSSLYRTLILIPCFMSAIASNTIAATFTHTATPITQDFVEIVDNSTLIDSIADDFCADDPEGAFFYSYTPTSAQDIHVLAEGQDTELAVYNMTGAGSCWDQQDNDNIDPADDWYVQNYPSGPFIDGREGESGSENFTFSLDANIDYIIAIYSNESSERGEIRVSVTLAAATPVPASPLWLLGVMAVLLSVFGARKLRNA